MRLSPRRRDLPGGDPAGADALGRAGELARRRPRRQRDREDDRPPGQRRQLGAPARCETHLAQQGGQFSRCARRCEAAACRRRQLGADPPARARVSVHPCGVRRRERPRTALAGSGGSARGPNSGGMRRSKRAQM
eukprot:1251352-Prymnesium_polylepis.1